MILSRLSRMCVSFLSANLHLFVSLKIKLVMDLCGYNNYKPKYTLKGVDELSRAAITSSAYRHR